MSLLAESITIYSIPEASYVLRKFLIHKVTMASRAEKRKVTMYCSKKF